MRQSLVFLFLLTSQFLSAQKTDTLHYTEFLNLLFQNHPIAKIADLQVLGGLATLANARGAFEPTVTTDYNRKSFEGKNYYSIFDANVKIPAWIGEVKMGYQNNYGININNENLLPNVGQPYIGIDVPLIKNLITDKKRTALRKANLFTQSSEFERIQMLNNLLVSAIAAYWQWSTTQQIFEVNSTALRLANQRHSLIIEAAKLGDKPTIDTVESLTQVQYRTIALHKSRAEFMKATFDMSNHIWNAEGNPVIIDTALISQMPSEMVINDKLILDDQLKQIINQPELQIAQLKVKSLDLERKLRIENLKPQLNTGYYILGNGADFSANKTTNPFVERYKFGVNFQFPLLFAQARSEYKIAKYELNEAQLNLAIKSQQISNKIKSYWAEVENTRAQLGEIQQVVGNNRKLLDAEQDRFFFGESNVFLINSRENKYVESLEKKFELFNKFYLYEAIFYQQSGTLLQKTKVE
jgi:outer membrane protein TolC